jgi:allophanate hydrolase subunit 1
MTSAAEIRENLVRLLAHEQSLNSFTDWLTRSTWNIHRENDEIRELVGEIHSVLTEYSSRHLSAKELRQKLSALTAIQRMNNPRRVRSREKHRA